MKVFEGRSGPRCGQVDTMLGQVGPKLASGGDLGAKMAEDGEDDLKNAASDRQDAVLETLLRSLWRYLKGFQMF